MGVLTYKRDGYVTVSELDKILTKMDAQMAQELEKFLSELTDKVIELRSEVRKLRAELEAERRLRLGSRK